MKRLKSEKIEVEKIEEIGKSKLYCKVGGVKEVEKRGWTLTGPLQKLVNWVFGNGG